MATILELSEKEIRVIKVALWKHYINCTDDDGKAKREDLQSFVDCCYETHKMFCDMESTYNFHKKEFEQLSGSRTLKP